MCSPSSQPYDFGFDNGEDTGLILVNGVPYAYDKAVTADAPWLTETPTAGTVPAGRRQAITVSVDSTGLDARRLPGGGPDPDQ